VPGPTWNWCGCRTPTPGTTATTVPEGCQAADWEGAEADYLCFVDTPILEDAPRTFTFALRIGEVIRNATGRAFFAYTMPNEGNPANDSGTIDDSAGPFRVPPRPPSAGRRATGPQRAWDRGASAVVSKARWRSANTTERSRTPRHGQGVAADGMRTRTR
jgi:hypothetical protein